MFLERLVSGVSVFLRVYISGEGNTFVNMKFQSCLSALELGALVIVICSRFNREWWRGARCKAYDNPKFKRDFQNEKLVGDISDIVLNKCRPTLNP